MSSEVPVPFRPNLVSFWSALGKTYRMTCYNDAARRANDAICRSRVRFYMFVLIARFNRDVLDA